MKYKDKRYFRTTSFYTAVFLFSKGAELANIDKTFDPKKAEFVFLDSIELQSLLNSYDFAKENDPSVSVDARKFVFALKTIKDKLFRNL